MRRRYLRSRDEERYLEAFDEARERLHYAKQEHLDALDEVEELERTVGPEGPNAEDAWDRDSGRPRRRSPDPRSAE